MALSRSQLSFNQGISGAGTVTSDLITPADGSILWIITEATEDGTLTSIGLTNSATLTPTKLFDLSTGGGFKTLQQVHYVVIGTGVAMTFALTNNGGGSHGSIRVIQYTGQHASPIGATASANNAAGADGAQSLTLSANPASDSEVLSGIGGTLSSGGMSVDPGSDQTEIWDVSFDDWNSSQGQIRTGSTSTSIAWADVAIGDAYSAGNPSLWAVEIIAAAGGGGSAAQNYMTLLGVG